MPRSAAERAVSVVGRISRRRVAASLMNSSPLSGPPIDAFAPPTAIAIRSSGSPGGAPAGRGTLPGQPSDAHTATLAAARFAQGRIELGDGEIDIRIRMRARHETGLERGGCQEDPARERGLVPACEERRVAVLRVVVIADWTRRKVRTPHRPGVSGRERNPATLRRGVQPRDQPRGALLECFVKTRAIRLP